jgi:radical SAM-linked protein
MKARIKFQKYGAMKFIGHLDVMRYFQKLFRRADIDNEYSKGFSPHQIMSFAAPLGVGLTSDGEYLDVQLLSSEAPEIMLERMNGAATEGIRIIDFHPLLDPEENKKIITAMSLVASADYLVSLKDGYGLGDINTPEEFNIRFSEFIDNKEIVINKKTKTSEKEVNIRPMITLTAFDKEEYVDKLNALLKPAEQLIATENYDIEITHKPANSPDTSNRIVNKPESVADVYDNVIKLFLQTDTGSAANLKPELVMEAFCEFLGIPYQEFAWQVHRLEVYTRDLESGKLISLDKLER